ncbi:titin homolog [Asparagus officinalis]|uniref:titin homolog n=1 Tax=Asparagus officinalis TaxID=4686 RepID=UPI00098DF563|nr:titin homolog [Asparagus officinalis]
MSPRGKEAAESSRKGKEPALPADSEEEFDSEATETSEGEGENESSSEEVSGLPDSFFDRGLVRPSVAPTQPQAAPKKRKERVVMEHPNRMTVEVLSCDEEDEEDMVPLIRRQISRTSTQAQTQVSPRAELRTKHRHEGSDARPLKKQKKALLHFLTFKLISCSTSAGSREEGELPADAASPGGMEIEETSFVQQMHDALKEGSADVPPTPDVDPSAADTVKLKEAGTSSGALESAPTNEDVTMHESVGGETTHTTEVEEFNEHHLDFNLSEGDHEYISDLLSGKTPGAATESSVGVGSTEAGPSERPVAGTDTTIIIGTSDRLESSELVPWTRTEVDLQSSVLEPQPSTPMDPMMIEVTVTPQISPVATKARPTEEVGTSADVVTRIESPLKESLSLDPPSSETLVEKVPDVAGASTATIPEPILTVQESRLPSLSEPSHAEGSSVEFGML